MLIHLMCSLFSAYSVLLTTYPQIGPLVNGMPIANMLISVFNNTVEINIEFTNAVSSLVS